MTRDNDVTLNLSKSMVVIGVLGSTTSNSAYHLRIRTGKIQVISYTKMCTTLAHIITLPCIFIIIIIIIIISFMQGIYTYIPETNYKYVPKEHSVAAILLLLFMVLISLVSVLNLLHFYISTFRRMCAVHNMAVFCSSLTFSRLFFNHISVS